MSDNQATGRTKYFIGIYDSASHVRVHLHEQDMRKPGVWKDWVDTYRHRVDNLTVYTGWDEPPPMLPPGTALEGSFGNGGVLTTMRKFLIGNGLLDPRPFTIYYKDRNKIDEPPATLLEELRDEASTIRGKIGDIISAYPLWRGRLEYLRGGAHGVHRGGAQREGRDGTPPREARAQPSVGAERIDATRLHRIIRRHPDKAAGTCRGKAPGGLHPRRRVDTG